jgi:protein tyrosine phosphatase (PTP) superfamily phosphohydrolase (DUF442 family)
MFKRLLLGLAFINLVSACSQDIPNTSFEIGTETTNVLSNQITTPNIFRFGKVDARLYRGALPTNEDLLALKQMGIKSIVSFRGLGDPTEKDQIAQERDAALRLNLKFFNVQIPFDSPVTSQEIKQFFDTVENPANQPLYVHCKGGRDRTGTMVALYRIKNSGFTGPQALKEMQDYAFVPTDYPLFTSLVLNFNPLKPYTNSRAIVKNSISRVNPKFRE